LWWKLIVIRKGSNNTKHQKATFQGEWSGRPQTTYKTTTCYCRTNQRNTHSDIHTEMYICISAPPRFNGVIGAWPLFINNTNYLCSIRCGERTSPAPYGKKVKHHVAKNLYWGYHTFFLDSHSANYKTWLISTRLDLPQYNCHNLFVFTILQS
jgi:hypothetical protein